MDELTIKQKVAMTLAAIRKRRTDLQLTQEYMAFKMNISQNAYSKIELGITKLRIDQLLLISSLLKTTAEDLLNYPSD